MEELFESHTACPTCRAELVGWTDDMSKAQHIANLQYSCPQCTGGPLFFMDDLLPHLQSHETSQFHAFKVAVFVENAEKLVDVVGGMEKKVSCLRWQVKELEKDVSYKGRLVCDMEMECGLQQAHTTGLQYELKMAEEALKESKADKDKLIKDIEEYQKKLSGTQDLLRRFAEKCLPPELSRDDMNTIRLFAMSVSLTEKPIVVDDDPARSRSPRRDRGRE